MGFARVGVATPWESFTGKYLKEGTKVKIEAPLDFW